MSIAMRTFGLATMPNYWPLLPEILVPVNLVVGSLDTKFRAVAERMLSLLPRATLTIVEGVGHNVVLERPDAVAAELRAPSPAPA